MMEGGRVREAVCGSLNSKAQWQGAFFPAEKHKNDGRLKQGGSARCVR